MCIVILSATTSFAGPQDKEIKIGVLAHRGFEKALGMWIPTAEYLSKKIPNYRFKILPLTNDDVFQMVEQRKIDFILTNPASYAILETSFGISRIATIRNMGSDGAYTVFGAVIITRADRQDILYLKHLKNKSFMAVHRNAFGGWWMAWREMQQHNFDISALGSIEFVGFPQDQIVYAVRDGSVDAGTVRTNILERMASEGKININEFRVLAPKDSLYFPFQHSTQLYPEWPFATTKSVPYKLAKRVSLALLSMRENSRATQAAKILGWTVPLDYQPVHALMQQLHVGPYQKLGQVIASDVIIEYWQWILGAFVAFVAMVLITLYIIGLNQRLLTSNAHLQSEIVERQELELKLRYQAMHDDLTKLPNRVLFNDRLQQAIFAGKRDHSKFAVGILDLNDFKLINDRLGHQAGDELLRRVSERFQMVLRKTDTIARYGGDEFVMIVHKIDDESVAVNMIEKCLAKLEEPIVIDEHYCRIRACAGIACYPDDGDSAQTLIHHADIALYRAKHAATNIALYNTTLEQLADSIPARKNIPNTLIKLNKR